MRLNQRPISHGFRTMRGFGCDLAAGGVPGWWRRWRRFRRPTSSPGSRMRSRTRGSLAATGDWDYLTLDPAARQLFITHQTAVQVVDVDTGTVAGEVTGFTRCARGGRSIPMASLAMPATGAPAWSRVFDRRTFQVTAKIPLAGAAAGAGFRAADGNAVRFRCLPDAGPATAQMPASPTRPSSRRRSVQRVSAAAGLRGRPTSRWSASIDPDKQTRVADVRVCGVLGVGAGRRQWAGLLRDRAISTTDAAAECVEHRWNRLGSTGPADLSAE